MLSLSVLPDQLCFNLGSTESALKGGYSLIDTRADSRLQIMQSQACGAIDDCSV